MNKLSNKKEINILTLLFSVTYMISYVMRTNYGAVISEMEDVTNISRSMLSTALTGTSITYGICQIASGICGDKFSPKKLVSFGLTVSTVMNILLPLCENPYYMLVVWCINGFAQSFMWPPFVRLLTELLTEEDYKSTITKISWGGSCGTLLVYLISPLLIAVSGWKSVFIFSAICGLIMIFFWNKYSYEVTPTAKKSGKSAEKGSWKMLMTPIMTVTAIAIILQGILKDGIATWMPTYISETYNMSNIVSILAGVILPIFNIFAVQLATKIYVNKITNLFSCAAVFFVGGAIATGMMYVFSGSSAAISVLSSALLTGCMYGVNLMFTCMLPPFFSGKGNVSTISGILNCCSYVGTAFSTYGVALLSEKMGWNFTIILWIAAAVIGAIICFASYKPWEKYIKGM